MVTNYTEMYNCPPSAVLYLLAIGQVFRLYRFFHHFEDLCGWRACC
jgi:hypothetical protein